MNIKSTIFLLTCFVANISCSTTNTISQEKGQQKSGSKNADNWVVVKSLAHIIGGQKALQSKLIYPEEARKNKIEKTLKADVLVNKNGEVEKITFKNKSGYGLEQASINAIKAVSFESGKDLKGDPIRMIITVQLVFKL